VENSVAENRTSDGIDWLGLLQSYLQPAKLLPLLAIVAAISFGAGLISWSAKSNMVPLAPGLDRQDSAAVIDFLNSSNEPFSIDAGSGLVLVPSDRARQLQIELAGAGLPQTSKMGLELLRQDQPLGTSQFMEQARYRHALETELSRTVASMRNVDSARIHLALPKRSVFLQRQNAASASVMVKMLPGRTLEKGQVRAIINLVGASVPYLDSDNVTIVDEWGALLSSTSDSGLEEISAHQFEFARKFEEHYAQRIETLLTPLVGHGRVRASVSAELDFSVEEQTAELYEADPLKIRSEQQQQNAAGLAAGGIPGALSNQPPADDSADDQTQNRAPSVPGGKVANLTRNYELDKRISHTRNAPGKIDRLSASVVIDNIRSTNEAGEFVDVPASEEDLVQFTALVRGAIGFNEERGDSILVFNKPFQAPEEIAPPLPAPLWKAPWIGTVAKQAGVVLIVLALILFVVRPALISLQPKHAQGDASKSGNVTGDTLKSDMLSLSPEGRQQTGGVVEESHGDILLMARNMARNDPRRVAKVVKDWVAEGANDG